MSTMASSQINSFANVYSTLYSGADQRKHLSSASLAFVWGIHRWRLNSPHKGPVTRKILPFDDVTNNQNSLAMTHEVHSEFGCGEFLAPKTKHAGPAKAYKSVLSRMYLAPMEWKHFLRYWFLWGESTGHRWIPLKRQVTRRVDVFFDLHLNKRLSKQSIRRWLETSSRS